MWGKRSDDLISIQPHLKQFCLEDIATAILIILIVHIVLAVRWMLKVSSPFTDSEFQRGKIQPVSKNFCKNFDLLLVSWCFGEYGELQ